MWYKMNKYSAFPGKTNGKCASSLGFCPVCYHTYSFFFSFSLPVSAGFNLLYNLQNNNECEMLPCYTVRRLKVIVLFLAVSSICSTSTSIFVLQHQQVFGVPFCRQDIDWMQLPVSQAGLYNDWFTFIRQSVRFSTELCIFSTGAVIHNV